MKVLLIYTCNVTYHFLIPSVIDFLKIIAHRRMPLFKTKQETVHCISRTFQFLLIYGSSEVNEWKGRYELLEEDAPRQRLLRTPDTALEKKKHGPPCPYSFRVGNLCGSMPYFELELTNTYRACRSFDHFDVL